MKTGDKPFTIETSNKEVGVSSLENTNQTVTVHTVDKDKETDEANIISESEFVKRRKATELCKKRPVNKTPKIHFDKYNLSDLPDKTKKFAEIIGLKFDNELNPNGRVIARLYSEEIDKSNLPTETINEQLKPLKDLGTYCYIEDWGDHEYRDIFSKLGRNGFSRGGDTSSKGLLVKDAPFQLVNLFDSSSAEIYVGNNGKKVLVLTDILYDEEFLNDWLPLVKDYIRKGSEYDEVYFKSLDTLIPHRSFDLKGAQHLYPHCTKKVGVAADDLDLTYHRAPHKEQKAVYKVYKPRPTLENQIKYQDGHKKYIVDLLQDMLRAGVISQGISEKVPVNTSGQKD